MILYLALGAFLAGLTMGGYGVKTYYDGAIAREKIEQAAAQAKLDERVQKAEAVAATHIDDMIAAYDAGEANAKTITKTIYVKGQNYVATTPVFSNPVCVVPDDGMQFLNGARAGVRAAADPGVLAPALPAAGAAAGRTDGNAVPANAAGHGPVGSVPPKPRPAN